MLCYECVIYKRLTEKRGDFRITARMNKVAQSARDLAFPRTISVILLASSSVLFSLWWLLFLLMGPEVLYSEGYYKDS